MTSHTMGEAIPYVLTGMVAIGAYLIWGIVQAWKTLGWEGVRKWTSAWAVSFRLVGWMPFAGAAVVLIPIVLFSPLEWEFGLTPFEPHRAVMSLLPLIAACHAAFLFSPGDEPFMEGLLVTPRPFAWLIWERWAVLVAPYTVLALASNLIVLARTGWEGWGVLVAWVPPFLFFVSVALFITFTSRQPVFGMTMSIILWFGLAFLADGILIRWPHLWPVHVYLRPEAAADAFDPRLHPVWVLFVSALFLAFAFRQLKDIEKLLAAAKA